MNVLMVHNHYQQAGGEDTVFRNELELLSSRGHGVRTYTKHNSDVSDLGSLELATSTIWSRRTYREVSDVLSGERFDVMHVHNTLPLVSPSVYYAARDRGVPIVQTLHNYRLLCPAATFLRDGAICEACLGKSFAWPSVLHACYRDDRTATAVIAGMLAVHRLRGTYATVVDRYIALTEFGRAKFEAGGIPAQRISVRPNYLPSDPGAGDGRGGYALYVGRLSDEKGIRTLLAAWSRSLGVHVPLRIVGDGPLAELVSTTARQLPGVTWLGKRDHHEVLSLMKAAMAVVIPSQVYEAFPVTLVESFAAGTPVIASDLGAMREAVAHDETGLRFPRSDAVSLETAVRRLAADAAMQERMRTNARATFESTYSAQPAYDRLMEIYGLAMGRAR